MHMRTTRDACGLTAAVRRDNSSDHLATAVKRAIVVAVNLERHRLADAWLGEELHDGALGELHPRIGEELLQPAEVGLWGPGCDTTHEPVAHCSESVDDRVIASLRLIVHTVRDILYDFVSNGSRDT